jgi:hypothetical protein
VFRQRKLLLTAMILKCIFEIKYNTARYQFYKYAPTEYIRNMRTVQQTSSTVWNKWSRSVKLVYAFYLFEVVHLHGIPLSLASRHGCSVVSTDISVRFINKTFHFCNTGWAKSQVSFWCFGPHCPCIKLVVLVYLMSVCITCWSSGIFIYEAITREINVIITLYIFFEISLF